MNQLISFFIPLLVTFFRGAFDVYIPCLALGILCATPCLIRRIVDHV